MSAYGTKKPGSDLMIQLGFPTNFEDAYAEAGIPEQYAPEAPMRLAAFPSGYDLQDSWHAQKMADAHRRVMNAVADTRRATNRALVSHAGYWAMPAPVLSQRIYANPSLGSGSADIYKPITRETPGLTGGVLRTKTGQEYGQRLLQARVAQLNTIDEAAAGLQEGEPITDLSISQGISDITPPESMVRLITLLDQLFAVVQAGPAAYGSFTPADLSTMITLLISNAPKMNYSELENILEIVEEMTERTRAYQGQVEDTVNRMANYMDPLPGVRGVPTSAERRYLNVYAETMSSIILKMREYLARMIENVNKSPNERRVASRSAVKDLGLTSVATIGARRGERGQLAQIEALRDADDEPQTRAARQAQQERAARRAAMRPRAPPAAAALQGQGRGGVLPMTAEFDMPAVTREDSEQNARGPRARFTVDERQVFGDNSGRYYGQTYQTAPEDGSAISHVVNAAANGIRNPFRAPNAAADARGEREFETAMNRTPDMRKARMMATAAAQKDARDAAAAAMEQARGMGRKKMMERPTRKEFNDALMRRVKSRGGSEASKKKVFGKMEKDLGESDEVKGIMMPIDLSMGSLGKRKPSAREGEMAMPGGEGKKPRVAKGPTPPKGKGKLRLINMAGKPHRGPFHQMPDGAYHSGAKHTKRSKPLTVAE